MHDLYNLKFWINKNINRYYNASDVAPLQDTFLNNAEEQCVSVSGVPILDL